MKTRLITFLLLAIWYPASAHLRDTSFTEQDITLTTSSGEIQGTLTLPVSTGGPVALIIAGSGPTDRNGNSPYTQNNAYQMLARELAKQGVASVRYDKRGVARSTGAAKSEADLRFEDYINDAIGWIELLKKDTRFKSVVVIGHSEGSLIGMVAAQRGGANKYVSIAGSGKPIDEILKEQLKANSEQIHDLAVPVLDSLKQGHQVKNVDRQLFMLFRPSVQPYIISWMKYDPQAEIKKLKIPVLIVQGTRDIQVPTENARMLNTALPASQLVIVQDMNHVLKIVDSDDRAANQATYGEPMRPLAPGLADAIAKFALKS